MLIYEYKMKRKNNIKKMDQVNIQKKNREKKEERERENLISKPSFKLLFEIIKL